ncbi:I78 family peptidase inhibitor [Pseudomonas syringae USA007]|uniref:I78 family peptidase inhibitor n=1 Tax=Pseudomonas syringae USA007 TaxID=1357288 RepID=A0AAU8MA56_PSESX|nr:MULTISPECIES: I78 family peptidase inhibitor [Pseudomonas syringae group]MCR8717262.1 I78 family peptidase inhibitor [Pseudomonas syringae]
MTNEVIAQALQYLVGTRYVPTVKAYISEVTGLQKVIGPGDIATRDLNPMRLHVNVDNAGLVSGFSFG